MLKRIRAYLREVGATAVVIPHGDAYLNDDLRPEDERLACVTGFTGSAGLAIITLKRQVLFVDGRYVEQAKRQTNFEVLHVPNQITVSEWFEHFLHSNDVVVYDPWLLSVAQIERWTEIFTRCGAKLQPLDENLIDKFWLNKPKAKPIHTYDFLLKYAGRKTKEKLTSIKEIMKKNDIDAFVLCNVDTVSWLMNKRSDAVRYNPVFLDRLIVYSTGKIESFNEKAIIKLKDKVVGFDAYETPAKIKQELAGLGIPLYKMHNPFSKLQAIKNDTELKGMEKAALLDSLAVCKFFALLPSRIKKDNEYNAVEYLKHFRMENKLYKEESFENISAVDKNAALPHYRADEKNALKLSSAKIYLLDTGGQYACGTTDMTRTIALNKPTSEMKKRYTQVLKGHIALAMASFPKGTTGGQLDVLARQFLWADGADYNHGTGHGIGCFLNVHEAPPSVSPNNREMLLENMVLSNEPGFYAEGKFGIRIENMMKVVKSRKKDYFKFEMLTFVPFCDALIERDLLTEEEKNWIKDYYKKIKQKVYENVGKETQKWLKEQMMNWIA